MKQLWTKLCSGVGALVTWLKGAYSERFGQGSSTRLHIGEIVVTGCFVAIYLAIKTGKADHLVACATFIATSSTALYTANRFFNNKDLATQKTSEPPSEQTPQNH